MWIFGHLGIGSQIARPLGKKLPWGAILLGTLLPDLIDKPLYYGLKITGAGNELVSCTRAFGHTALLVLLVCGIAWIRHSRAFAGLALGMATHLALDGVQDALLGIPTHESSSYLAALYPFTGHFAGMPFHSLGEHLMTGGTPIVFVAEIVGAFLLFREWRRRRPELQKKYFASKKTAL